MVNTVTNKVVRVIGKDESLRFLNLALFQGAPSKQIQTLAMAASSNPLLQDKLARDPTLFATAFNKARFYMFGRGVVEESKDRDVYNERPTAEDHVVVAAEAPVKKALPTAATIHTSMGDIHMKLFPHIAPKTVENFATHARNGYYNNVIFHRIIKKFVSSTSTPRVRVMRGEGAQKGLTVAVKARHPPSANVPTVSVFSRANPSPHHHFATALTTRCSKAATQRARARAASRSGAASSRTRSPRSQSTTAHIRCRRPTQVPIRTDRSSSSRLSRRRIWTGSIRESRDIDVAADGSVFGRATGGMEVIHAIENVRTDKNDKPYDEVRMMSITVE